MSDRIIKLNEEDEEIGGPMGIWDFPVLNSAAEEPLIENITEEPVLDILAEQSVLTQQSNDSDLESVNDTETASSSQIDKVEEELDSAVNTETEEQEIQNKPTTLRNRIKDPFQYTEVEVGETETVFRLDISSDEAILIEEIANEWYQGLTFTLNIDGNKREYQRSSAETDDPRDVSILASDYIEWTVENDGTKSRSVGVLTDGQYITQEQYDELVEDDVATL